MRQPRSRALSIVLTALLMASVVAPVSAKRSLSSLMQDWRKTSSKIAQLQKTLRDSKHKKKLATKDLAVAQHRLEITRQGLMDIQYQLKQTKTKLTVTQVELQRAQQHLEQRNALLSTRLADNYKHGNVTYMGVLLGADDFSDMMSRGYLVSKVLGSDVSLINSIEEAKRAIEKNKAILHEQAEKKAAQESQQRQLTVAAHEQTDDCARIVSDVSKDVARQEQMIADLEANSRSIAAMMRAMQTRPSNKNHHVQAWHGKFLMPCNGRISCPFGMRMHPILHVYKMHTGTDIAAPYGATIVAAGSGEVAYAGWQTAYGNTVIIRHSDDLITFYGHCSRLLVSAGQIVKQGQPIAKVGSTGLSTGPHCHFEVQRNGRPVSPF